MVIWGKRVRGVLLWSLEGVDAEESTEIVSESGTKNETSQQARFWEWFPGWLPREELLGKLPPGGLALHPRTEGALKMSAGTIGARGVRV